MTKCNEVETEHAREEEEEGEAETLVAAEAARVSLVLALQLSERGALFEGTSDGGGNAEGENDDHHRRHAEKHRVQPHPHVLNQTLPELEGVFDGLEIEEECAHRHVREHAEQQHAQSHTPRVEGRGLPTQTEHHVLLSDLALGHPAAHAAAASMLVRRGLLL